MPQASGSSASISIWEEVTYGVRPVGPSMFKIKAATEGVGLKGVVEKLISKSITSARGVPSSRSGNHTVSGPIPFELPLLGIGKVLKHVVGQAAAPVSVKLVSLATGLTNLVVLHADTGAPAGLGTITKSGATLTWAAFGETAGAAVDVTAGGEFTLQSSTASHAIYVLVTGSVVGTSASATVGAAAYKHVITRGTLPVGFGAEIAYPDITQYQAFDGLKADSASLSISNSGMVTGTINTTGASFSAPSGTATGTPTSVAHVPFAQHECTLMDGGAAAKMTAFSLDISNELDAQRAIGSRTLTSLKEGMGSASGKVTTLFEDATYINKVINETASAVRALFKAADGTGLVLIKLPNVKYYGDAGPGGIPTAKGLVVSSEFQADSSVGGTDISITIINSEATI